VAATQVSAAGSETRGAAGDVKNEMARQPDGRALENGVDG